MKMKTTEWSLRAEETESRVLRRVYLFMHKAEVEPILGIAIAAVVGMGFGIILACG